LPVAIIGKFMGVPVITHEQTTGMGLSNRIISRIADRVCLSYPIFGKRSHGSNRTVVTGLPLRRSLFNPPKESSVTLEGQAPIIYITGGATGARSMNQLLYPIIPRLLSRFEIVHQVGTAWLGEAKKFRAGIRGDKRRRYHVFGYLDTQDHSFIMNKAVLLVGRSGANTVAEVAGLEIPAVFIPLPWSAAREQQKNAELLVREGKAILVDQEGISPSDLLESIVRFERSQSAVHRHRSNQEYDASRRVVDQIFRVLSSR
jgi:UDP-N-acetylglucosamine--N-acetylmuramyl-(pentapeptide) pyrophosphoryl-undecaprenol N-acetylglucosamine transferase